LSKSAEMVLGQLVVCVFVDSHTARCPNQEISFAQGWVKSVTWVREFCDETDQ
jgi:hypothetical protein